MSDFGVDVEQRDGVAWLIIRNPSRMNALRLEMWEAIPPIVARLDADPAVRVCVVRGAGRIRPKHAPQVRDNGPYCSGRHESPSIRRYRVLPGRGRTPARIIAIEGISRR